MENVDETLIFVSWERNCNEQNFNNKINIVKIISTYILCVIKTVSIQVFFKVTSH